MTITQRNWWKDGVVYQIYPSSFADTTGNGLGDLRGIIGKLDYLKNLGIDTLWICPMYDSPQFDMGYDIRNYETVYPPFGTVEDAEALIKACHDRGLRIIFDLVINHTSYEHAWFKESRSSKHSSKRDWYIWRPAKYTEKGERKPPNNWRSIFGGSAWEWDEITQEYYLHLFVTQQPDLNWENEDTRKAIYDTSMKFWLDRGIDGFRVDTVNLYSKNIEFPDAPITDPNSEWQNAFMHYCNGPRMHEWLREMAQVTSKYGDIMTVGECPSTPNLKDVLSYVHPNDKQLGMVFDFDVVDLGQGATWKYQTKSFPLVGMKKAFLKAQSIVGEGGWTSVFLENHDQARSISRFASDDPKYRAVSGKLLAMMLATLTGTLFIYEGQEIGMINCPKEWDIDDYQCIEAKNYHKMVHQQSNGDKAALAKAVKAIQKVGRDNARTPMHWDSSTNAGFTTGTPWIKVMDSYTNINVREQIGDNSSVLSFWKKMLVLRKTHRDLFVYGTFEILDYENGSTFTYIKAFKGERALVTLNFTETPCSFEKPKTLSGELKLVMSNVESPGETLSAYEGRIYLVH